MGVVVRQLVEGDILAARAIWNQVVEDGRAFPQLEGLSTDDEARTFFQSQTYTAVACEDDRVLGLYILHPNNVGRCSHVANASYAVDRDSRGRGLGRALVSDCLAQLAPHGFRGLQFNAVVVSNLGAIRLYESLGFQRIGVIPGGYQNIHGVYEDMIIFYHPAE